MKIFQECRAIAQDGIEISASSKLGYLPHRPSVLDKDIVVTDLGDLALHPNGIFHDPGLF